MKIRLHGVYENFTGEIGAVSFVDGLSTTNVSMYDAHRIASGMPASTEDGKDPFDYGVDYGQGDVPDSIPPELTAITTVADEQAAAAASTETVETVEVAPVLTREALEAIADKEGIAGIRAISDPLGIKGTSIKGLIDQILSGKTVVNDATDATDSEE